MFQGIVNERVEPRKKNLEIKNTILRIGRTGVNYFWDKIFLFKLVILNGQTCFVWLYLLLPTRYAYNKTIHLHNLNYTVLSQWVFKKNTFFVKYSSRESGYAFWYYSEFASLECTAGVYDFKRIKDIKHILTYRPIGVRYI